MANEELRVVITAKDEATRAIMSVGNSLKSLSKTATAVAGVLAGVFVYKTVDAFGDFDQAMRNSMAIMGDVSDEMREKLINQAREVARTMAVSHKEAAESYYYLASAGLTAAESLEAMPKVARLAEAAQLDMATATDIAVNSLRAFELSVSDLEHVTDVLTGTVTATNTNMMQLGEALKYVAPVAQSVGWSIEEVSAAIGILANSGIKGSQAGTGLRRVLSELLNPSDRAKEAIERLGLSMEELDPRTHSLTEILKKLKDAGADAGDIMLIFGDRGGQVALKLMAAGDATDELTNKLKTMSGVTEEIAKQQEEGLNAQLKILKNNMNDLAITIGEQLAPVIKELADKLKEMAQDKATVEFAKSLGEGMAKAFSAMADAFMAVAGVMDRLPPGLGQLIGALTAVTVVVAPLLMGLGFLASALSGLSGVIAPVVGAVGGLSGIMGALGSVAGVVSGALGAIGTALAAVAGAISLPIILIGALIAALIALIFNIGGARDKAWAFAQMLGEFWYNAIMKAKDVLLKLKDAVKEAFDKMKAAVISYAPILMNAAVTVGKKIIEGIRNGLANIKATVTQKLNEVKTAVSELPGRVRNAAVAVGRAIVNGIKSGLSNLASTLKNALLDPIKNAINSVKDALGIGSPSVVFKEIGKNVVEGYAIGIEKAARKLTPELPTVSLVNRNAAIPTIPPAGNTANINIVFEGVAIRDDRDIESLADAIEERLGRKLKW